MDFLWVLGGYGIRFVAHLSANGTLSRVNSIYASSINIYIHTRICIFVFRGWFATQILARCGLCNAGLLAVFTVKFDKKPVDFAGVVQN